MTSQLSAIDGGVDTAETTDDERVGAEPVWPRRRSMPARAAPLEGRNANRLVIFLAFLATSAATHATGLLHRKITSDEASVATAAHALLSGGRLYLTIADRKPPIVPLIYAAVFWVARSTDIRLVRAAAFVAAAIVAFLINEEAKTRYGSATAGIVAGGAFLIAVASLFPEDAQAATFEVFMLVPMTLAVMAANRGATWRAGVWLGLAVLCKQTAATALLPVCFLAVRRRGWTRAGGAAAVAAAVVAATGAVFGLRNFIQWSFTGNAGYLELQGSVLRAVGLGAAVTAGVTCLQATPIAVAVAAARRRLIDADLTIWFISGLVAVGAGLRFFGHYYLQLLPPLALMAAAGLPLLTRPLKVVAGALSAGTLLVMGTVALRPWGDKATAAYPTIAAVVRDVSGPKDTVFVWGELPEVYWASNRLPGTRFVHTGFITGNSGGRPTGTGTARNAMPGAAAMLRADFHRRLPDIVVDTSTTTLRHANLYPLSATPVWHDFGKDYELVRVAAGVRIYRRIASAASTSP